MNTTDKAKQLILFHNKTWLSDKLGISRVTLDKRLIFNNWKLTEIAMIKTLK